MARKHFFINNIAIIIFYTIIVLFNLGIFLGTLIVSLRGKSGAIEVLFAISSALGKCLLFDSALLPITVCRRMLAWVRETPLHVVVPVDNHRSVHRALSLLVCCLALVHAAAAISHDVLEAKGNPKQLIDILMKPDTKHSGWMNLGMLNVTGFACLLVIIIIVVTSLLRHHMSFLAFFLTHQLYVLLYGLMIMHAGTFWIYLVVPVGLWVTELMLRWYHRPKASTILEVTLLPSNIVVIVIARPPHLIFKPGDYIFIQIPEVGKFEWVKFTITSAPEQTDLMAIHVPIMNNWTFRLRNYFLRDVSFHYIPHRLHALESITVLQRAYKSWRNLCGDFQNIEVPMGKPRETRKERLQRNQVDAMMVEEKPLTMDVVISEDEIEPEVGLAPTQTTIIAPLSATANLSRPNLDVVVPPVSPASKLGLKAKMEVAASQFGGFATGYSVFTLNYGKTLHFNGSSGEGTLPAAERRGRGRHVRHSIIPTLDEQRLQQLQQLQPVSAPPVTQVTSSSVPKLPHISVGQGVAAAAPPPTTVLPTSRADTSISSAMKRRQDDTDGDDDDHDDVNYFDRKIEVFVDGPYGNTGNERSGIFSPRHAIIALIGPKVEPFASVLQSILIRYRSEIVPCPNCACEFKMQLPSSFMNIRKVDFVWVNSDMEGFEWFLELLDDMDQYQRQHSLLQNFLQLYLFKTGMKPMPSFTPLRKQLMSGKPKWDELLQLIMEKSEGGIEVFFSGPRAGMRVVRKACRQLQLPFNVSRF